MNLKINKYLYNFYCPEFANVCDLRCNKICVKVAYKVHIW